MFNKRKAHLRQDKTKATTVVKQHPVQQKNSPLEAKAKEKPTWGKGQNLALNVSRD